MASITIRDLDDALGSVLRDQAAVHGRSVEEEARDIISSALSKPADVEADLATSIRALFAPLGGVDLPMPPREPMRDPPSFGR